MVAVRLPATPDGAGGDVTKQVMTVLGPIAPEELGFTQTHEHLVLNLKRASHRLDALQNNESLIVGERGPDADE
jgi:hypothetical protein